MEKTLRDEFLLHEILGFLRGLGLDELLGAEKQKTCIEYAQRLRLYTEEKEPTNG